MIPELGHFALILALCLALVQSLLPLAGAWRRVPAWMAVARPAAAGQFVFLAIAFGALVHAFSHRSPPGLRLGEVLVRQGALGTEDLSAALEEHGRTGAALGEVLMRGGWVRPEDLRAALSEQVRELFRRLWTHADARYAFQQCAPSGAERAAWNVTQLLLEGARREDERRAG